MCESRSIDDVDVVITDASRTENALSLIFLRPNKKAGIMMPAFLLASLTGRLICLLAAWHHHLIAAIAEHGSVLADPNEGFMVALPPDSKRFNALSNALSASRRSPGYNGILRADNEWRVTYGRF